MDKRKRKIVFKRAKRAAIRAGFLPKEFVTAKPRTVKKYMKMDLRLNNFIQAYIERAENENRIRNRIRRLKSKKKRKKLKEINWMAENALIELKENLIH